MKRNENCENVGAQVMRIVKGSQRHTGGDRSQDRVRTSAGEASSCYSEEPNAADSESRASQLGQAVVLRTQQESTTWRVPVVFRDVKVRETTVKELNVECERAQKPRFQVRLTSLPKRRTTWTFTSRRSFRPDSTRSPRSVMEQRRLSQTGTRG